MLTKSIILTLTICTAMTTAVLAKEAVALKKVFVEKGNLYYCHNGKKKTQLTSSDLTFLPNKVYYYLHNVW